MAKLRIEIDLDNAAFDDEFALAVRECMESVMVDMHYRGAQRDKSTLIDSGIIPDINGNAVGTWRIS